LNETHNIELNRRQTTKMP